MASTTSLDVSAVDFPSDRLFTFNSVSYLLRFRKNMFEGYSVEIYTPDGKTFLYANKIVYGQNIMDTILAPFQNEIIPFNPALITGDVGTTEVNDSTLGKEVKLLTAIEV